MTQLQPLFSPEEPASKDGAACRRESGSVERTVSGGRDWPFAEDKRCGTGKLSRSPSTLRSDSLESSASVLWLGLHYPPSIMACYLVVLQVGYVLPRELAVGNPSQAPQRTLIAMSQRNQIRPAGSSANMYQGEWFSDAGELRSYTTVYPTKVTTERNTHIVRSSTT